MRRWGLVILVILGVFWARQTHLASYESSPPTGQLEVHFIDVGKGDSILIRTPDGVTALIDGGPARSSPLPYLQAQSITRLDVVIATHPHEDHIGGLISVMNTLSVGTLWTSGAATTTQTYERFLDAIDKHRIPYHEVRTGQTIPLGTLSLNVVYGVSKASKLNNTSLVLRLDHGETSFLFMGDAEIPVENYLLAHSAPLLPATVFKIAHHGSKTSSSFDFVRTVSPTIAIYTAGKDNHPDHPAAVTLKTFEDLGIPVFGTDHYGTIKILSNGETLNLVASDVTFSLATDEQGIATLPFPMTPIYLMPSAVTEFNESVP